MSIRQESPIFSRLHDLVLWLLRTTRKFPRDQRFVLARRVMDKAFSLEDALVAASRDRVRVLEHLVWADVELQGLRRSLVLAEEMEFLTPRQHQHVAGLTAEIGRLLGGWRKRLEA